MKTVISGQESGNNPWEESQRELITRVLVEQDGNISATARKLVISRPTLLAKMKKFKITIKTTDEPGKP